MKNKFTQVIIIIITLLIGIFIGKFFFVNDSLELSSKEIRKSFNYQFINPLIECESGITVNNQLSSLKKSVQNIIDQEINNQNVSFISVYFRDLNNGPWFGINEKEDFAPASLIKVPVLITYLKKAERNPEILNQKILNPDNQQDGVSIQNVQPSKTLTPNQEYTIDELLQRMIIYSDNDAYNNLVKNINVSDLFQVYQDLDIDISKASENPNGNIINVKDYASFFRILFNASYLNQDMSEKALNILSQTEYTNALVAGIPKNIPVSHKFGERKFNNTNETQFHDCGIVYLPKKPYLVCIMTRGKDIEKANTSIKKISQKIFQYINNPKD